MIADKSRFLIWHLPDSHMAVILFLKPYPALLRNGAFGFKRVNWRYGLRLGE
jgi:hypothetical protein